MEAFLDPRLPSTRSRASFSSSTWLWALYSPQGEDCRQGVLNKNNKDIWTLAWHSHFSSTSKPVTSLSLPCSLEPWGPPTLGCVQCCCHFTDKHLSGHSHSFSVRNKVIHSHLDYLRAQGLKACNKVQPGTCAEVLTGPRHTSVELARFSAVLHLWPSYELRCCFRLIRKLRVVWSTSIIGFGFFFKKDWESLL